MKEENYDEGSSPNLQRQTRSRDRGRTKPLVNYIEPSITDSDDYYSPPPKRARTDLVNLSNETDEDLEVSADSELQDQEESPPEPSRSQRGKKSKKSKQPKPVPYQPVSIPFGLDEIESLLSHRKTNDQDEFLVKYKYQSLHHATWLTTSQVESKTKQGKARIKKLLANIEADPIKFEEPINPVHLTIDRIIDEGEIHNKKVSQVYLLVKWNGLPYESATWEKVEKVQELDESKALEFYSRQALPKDISRYVVRPEAHQFQKLDASPSFKKGHTLRDYQLEGLNWLNYCYHHHRSCIMADEMGLGKTVQSVSFLNQVYQSQIRGPFIVVAPLSTIPHWEREFAGWTDLNTIVYHGSITSRNLIIDTEFYYKDSKGLPITERLKFDVLITSYEMLACGQAQLRPIPWRVAIFDEAHRLKNAKSKLQELLQGFHFEHRVLLTGTPLQNSVIELFNLLKFLDPVRFHSESDFLAKYGDLKTCSEVTELQDLLKPLMLRRFKEDVEKSIPDKEETVIEVELTRTQKVWYRAILERNFTWIQRGGGRGAEGPSLNNIMMELRKCCNHPFLIKGAEDKVVAEEQVDQPEDYTRVLIEASGKLVLLDKLLPRLRENGHKVLIFSQMTKVLDLLTEYLARRSYPYERIDGNVKGSDRQLAIDRYSNSTNSFIFLLCTRAGGVGINLTAADTVVIFDSDWNPQNDLQAQARAHRIGQTRPVKIYRLLCANTYERQMFDRANLKLGLDKAVMQKMTGTQTDTDSGLSKKEVEELLKLGAYGALLDDDESNKFCTEDIDHILERRTLVVQREGNQKGSAFSKASFSTFDNDTTDLNDPDFWNKWAAKANLAPEDLVATNPLILDHPRTRRRATRFDTLAVQTNNKPGESDSEFSSYSEEDPEADSENVQIRIWRMDERSKLERSLMIYGFSRWEAFAEVLPKRTIPDIRACALHYVWFLLHHSDFSKWIVASDRPGIEKDIKAALVAEGQRQDPQVNWETLLIEGKIPYPDANEQQIVEFQSYIHNAPPSTIERIIKKPKALFYRLQILYRICEVIVPSKLTQLEEFTPPRTNSLIFPAPWWDEDSDRDILVGVQRHGYLQFIKIRTDPELSFSRFKYVDDPNQVADGLVLWPSWAEIGARLRRLISAYFSPPHKSAKHSFAVRGVMKSTNSQDGSPRLVLERSNLWFPKPLRSFLQVLATFGIEHDRNFSVRHWEQFRTLADLPKRTDRELDAILYLVIKNYIGVLQSDAAREVRLRNSGVLEFGQGLLSVLPTCSDPLPASWVPPTPEKAKRLIKRILQLDKFRSLVKENNVTPYLASIHQLPGFPSWWDPGFHNQHFITALLRYGVANLSNLVQDSNLPFTQAQSHDWPKEAQVISWIERLIYLHTVANRGKGNHSSSKDHGYSMVIYDPIRRQFTKRSGLDSSRSAFSSERRSLTNRTSHMMTHPSENRSAPYSQGMPYPYPRSPVNGTLSHHRSTQEMPLFRHEPIQLGRPSHRYTSRREEPIYAQDNHQLSHRSPRVTVTHRHRSTREPKPHTFINMTEHQGRFRRSRVPAALSPTHDLSSTSSESSATSDVEPPSRDNIKLRLILREAPPGGPRPPAPLRTDEDPDPDTWDTTSSLTVSPSDLQRALQYLPSSPDPMAPTSFSPLSSPAPLDSPLTSLTSLSDS